MCTECNDKNHQADGHTQQPIRSWSNKKLPKIVGKTFGVPLVRPDLANLMQGAYITRSGQQSEQHALIYKGDITNLAPDAIVTIRINSACYTGDIFHDSLCDCNWQMEEAFRIIDKDDGPGLVLYHFAHEGKGFGYFDKLKAFDGAMYPVPGDKRDFLHAVAILKDLGITRVRVMTNNPEKQGVLREHGIEIVDVVQIASSDARHADFYRYKREVWGHALPTLEAGQQPDESQGS